MQLRWCLSALALTLGAAPQTAPDVPPALTPPTGSQLALEARGSGFQIYACQAAPGGSGFAWTLTGPEAKLTDTSGKTLGRHYAGPTWESADGSQVKGKVAASVAAPDADAVPWLLLTAVAHQGNGVFSKVTAIQRLHTKGGKAPAAGCDAAHQGTQFRALYSADYYFYVSSR
jgi:hypothetical protein